MKRLLVGVCMIVLWLAPTVQASVTLAWDWGDFTGDIASVYFSVQRRPNASTTFSEVGQVAATTTALHAYTYTDTTVSVPQGQRYQVVARSSTGAYGDSLPSNELVLGFTATRVVFLVQPATTPAGALLPSLSVRYENDTGDAVPSQGGNVTVALGANPGGGVLTGTLTRTAVGGITTFDDLRISTSGVGYTLVATSPGFTSGTSASFTIAGASHVQFLAQPQGVLVNQVLPPVSVEFLNSVNGRVLTTQSVSVALGNNPGGATLGGTVTRAAVAGVATFNDLKLNAAGAEVTLTATALLPGGQGTLDPLSMAVVSVDSQETVGSDGRGINAIDGNSGTIWHTQWLEPSPPHPHQIILDTGGVYALTGVTYLPRPVGNTNGFIAGYQVWGSLTNSLYTLLTSGTLGLPQVLKTIPFPRTSVRYLKVIATSELNGNPWTSAAEIGALGLATSSPFTILASPPVAGADCHCPEP